MPSRREILSGIVFMSTASIVRPLRIALIGAASSIVADAARAQGKSGSNENNGNDSGASGSASGRGGGRAGSSRNGNRAAPSRDRSRRGNAPNAQPGNKAATLTSGSRIEVRHRNGMKERITNGRYVMTDAQGRTIINRIATRADLARLEGMAD